MEHGVGTASQGHIHGHRIGKRFLGHDIKGTDVLPQQIHDLVSCFLGKPVPCAIDSGYGSIAGESHSNGLSQAVHAVCGEHATARTTGRTGIVLIGEQLFLTDQSGCKASHFLKHDREARPTGAVAGNLTGKHRSTGDKNGRDVDPGGSHQHSRDNLVTVGDENQSIKRMGCCHDLDGISDDLTACQRVFHPCMTHCNTITYPNDRERDWVSPSLAYPALYSVDNSIKVNMSWDDLIGPIHDTNDRHVDFTICPSKCLHQ